MTSNPEPATGHPTIDVALARTSLRAGAIWIGLLAVVHIIKAEDVDPVWKTISYYAVGVNGWVMVLAVLAAAVSYATLALALGASRSGSRLGLVLLTAAAVGTAIGGLFIPDPVGTPPDRQSLSGTLHGLGAGSTLLLVPVAALSINLSLLRRSHEWAPARKALLATVAMPLAGVALFVTAQLMFLPQGGGSLGPGVPIGWPERIQVLLFAVWQATLAWLGTRASGGPPART